MSAPNIAFRFDDKMNFDFASPARHEHQSLRMSLSEIEQAQLAYRLVEPEPAYIFKHALVQDAVYGSLLKNDRKRLHRVVAETFEHTFANRLDEYAALLAYHYAEASDEAKTFEYALRAGDVAARISAYTEARLHYDAALNALAQLPDSTQNRRERVDTLLKQINVAWGFETAQQNLSYLFQAEALAQQLPGSDRLRVARVQSWIARVYSYSNELGKAMQYYEQVLNVAQASNDQELLGLALALGGRNFFLQGNFGKAVTLLEQALFYLEQIGNWQEWILTKVSLAISLGGQGRYQEGRRHGEQAVEKARALNDQNSLASAVGMTARVEFMAGDPARLLEETRELMKQAKRASPLVQYMVLGFRAWAEGRLGMTDTARITMASARAIAAQFSTRLIFQDWFTAARAEIEFNAGQMGQALRLAKEAVDEARTTGGIFAEGVARRVWGQVLAQAKSPDWDEAEQHFAASLQLFELGDARVEAARTRVAWGAFLRARGEEDAAREQFEKAAAQFETSGLTREMEATRALHGAPQERNNTNEQ